MKPVGSLVFSFIITLAYGQNAIGEWKNHLPFQVGLEVSQSETHIYYSSGLGIVSIDKNTQEYSFLTTVEGLSYASINTIKYLNSPINGLMVAFENSTLDIVLNEKIISLNQIANFKNFTGTKRINKIQQDSDGKVYLATSYGISVIDPLSFEFKFSTFTGFNVNDVLVYDQYIYLSSNEGIFRTALSNPFPENFSAWELLGESFNLPNYYTAGPMTLWNQQLFFEVSGEVMAFDGSFAFPFFTKEGYDIQYLSAEQKGLLIGLTCLSSCNNGAVVYFPDEYQNPITLDPPCINRPKYGIEDQFGSFWLADGWSNFRRIVDLVYNDCETFSFNSPYAPSTYSISKGKESIWVAAGGVNPTFGYKFLDYGVYELSQNGWKNYNRNTSRAFWGRDEIYGSGGDDDDLLDILTVAEHPENGNIYFGSFYEGLLELQENNYTLFDNTNSSLTNTIGDSKRTRISGLAFDDDLNLWVINHLAAKPLSVLLPDKSWKAFNPSCGILELHQVKIDNYGNKWVVSNSNGAGFIVFNENLLEVETDNQCKTFSSSNSELPTNRTNCLEIDQNGEVWVGTDQGIAIFDCGNDPFDNNCRGTKRLFEQNGIVTNLLSSEEIISLAIDGANRKWVGTKNGVFLLSEDGLRQLSHYTIDNSPLPSNTITAIFVEPTSGIVYFGSDKGMVSLKSDATTASKFHAQPLLIYPNPILPEYNGPIVIDGLAQNARVKITSITGDLVFETIANGGRAIWNGLNTTGQRVSTGVYLVFSSGEIDFFNSQKPDAATGKIFFTN
ncbi:MAG: two-component regulator propeller domain-containing protein [Saprospiraceae bacterium]|jgi:ligand-binding sensor domain-containing protein